MIWNDLCDLNIMCDEYDGVYIFYKILYFALRA